MLCNWRIGDYSGKSVLFHYFWNTSGIEKVFSVWDAVDSDCNWKTDFQHCAGYTWLEGVWHYCSNSDRNIACHCIWHALYEKVCLEWEGESSTTTIDST